MAAAFQLKLADFEGPLDLLLSLIEERKMHISNISLAQVADDFVAHLENASGTLPIGEMAQFVLVASTLMLIKSHSLLPNLVLMPEEQMAIGDLERRLELYQQIKNLSVDVKERFGAKKIWLNEGKRNQTTVFAPASDATLPRLKAAALVLIAALPKAEILPQVIVKKVLSLEEAMADLGARIQKALSVRFSEFIKDKAEKVNIIVSFLSLLELVKQGSIEVRQDKHFQDIAMETNQLSVPRY